ncbi:MAG: hypothetical protein ACYDD2_13840 [Candidatus Acidiferrales bacterium]
MKNKKQSGMALATTLIVLFLVVALVVGFSWMVLVDQRLGGINGDQQYAFYGAEAGLEKLTSNLGFLFSTNPSPSGAQVNALATAASTPVISGIQYLNPDGTLGYQIAFPTDNSGNPLAQNHVIVSGPYQGLTGLLTPFTLTATARNVTSGAEVRLQRNVQTVAIPVFQFGMFSETDLSYFPGPNFNFGGRVHTNGNLFLASGGTTWFQDKITAAGEVIRTNLSNGWPTSSGYTGNVFIPTTSGGCLSQPTATTATCRALGMGEGSVVGGAGPPMSAPNSNWTNISTSSPPTGYNGYIRNKKTGVSPLNLSITLNPNTFPIDLIRRGLPNEDTSNPGTLSQRYYSEASVRILLSDNISDLENLPCEDTSVLPTALAGSFNGVPIAASGAMTGSVPTPPGGNYNPYPGDGYWAPNGTPVLGAGVPAAGEPSPNAGYIKIEIQTTYAVPPAPCGTWKDVTAEVLNLGIAGRNLSPSSGYSAYGDKLLAPRGGSACAEPNPNAVIRLERIRDNPSTGTSGNYCGTGSTNPEDYWPNALFDTREGNPRDNTPSSGLPTIGGVMDYTELDINNLARYLTGAIGVNGPLAKDNTNSSYDFVVYFSDRRGNYAATGSVPGWPPASPSGHETGEYGFEDSVNPSSPNACPDGVLDTGETFDEVENPGNQAIGGTPEDYGAVPSPTALLPTYLLTNVPSTLTATATPCAPPANPPNPSGIWPGTYVNPWEARENGTLLFRRALKIVHGSNINLGTCPDGVACGLTIVSENPVYVQGDFNAGANGNFTGSPHIAASVIADAVSLLSNNWNDVNSFSSPYNPGGRAASTTTYRFGVVAGKGISFPHPGGYSTYQDFGTDGGVHNFLRFLEGWGGRTLFYKGSIVSFYYNRQAIGLYKCCSTVYGPPTRGYNFDSDFLTPTLLPPRTPLFRDVNTIGFSQTVLPTP